MTQIHSEDELNDYSKQELKQMVLSMQEQLTRMNQSYENLIEQIRIANQNQFGRKSEKLDVLEGQLSFFDEAEALSTEKSTEPEYEEIIRRKKPKKKGQREEDLKGFPEEEHRHVISDEELDSAFGKGSWRRLPDEEYKRLRYEPASWTVEKHIVEVAVGIGGRHQDEFLRGDRPADLIKNSIATPSLMAAIYNVKYVNHAPYYRIEQEFERNGVCISRQTMANWSIQCSERYLKPLYGRLKEELLKYHVNQCDETRVTVIRDGRPAGTDSWMWMHRSGEFYKDRPVILYEYQKTRHHQYPEEFYKDFQGVLVTDGLQQYHMLEGLIDGFTNANCWAHARRDFADAIKAIGKSDEKAIKQSVAYQALARIGAVYKVEEGLAELLPEERLRERQKSVKPLVEEYFAWVKERLADTSALPKGKTAKGLNYSVNQEKYLRVFLEDGEVPIDNSASERSIRPFTTGRRNWLFINSTKGADSSAVIYSIAETAKANNLNPYYYFRHILTELAKIYQIYGEIPPTELDALLPWSEELPEICHKRERR